MVFPWIGCGQCGLCAAGDEVLCSAPRALGAQRDGGFADHLAMVPMKAVTITSSYVGSLAEMHELMTIARSGRLPGLPLTTAPLAEATQALADLRAGRIRGRAILRP